MGTKISDSLTRLTVQLIEKGVSDFDAYSESMVKELGEQIKPFLKNAWDRAHVEYQLNIYHRGFLRKNTVQAKIVYMSLFLLAGFAILSVIIIAYFCWDEYEIIKSSEIISILLVFFIMPSLIIALISGGLFIKIGTSPTKKKQK